MTSPDPAARIPWRRPRADAPGVVDVDQSFDGDGLYGLRATLAAHASRLGVFGERADRLLIVASELATNAVRHGGGAGRLRLWQHGEVLYCQVSDDGPGIADVGVGTARPDPTSTSGGRGMWICRQLTDDMIIEHGGEHGRGAIVTVIISVDGKP